MADVALRDYVDKLMDEREERVAIRFEASQRALDHAARMLEHRLESLNGFREVLSAERSLFITRDMHDELRERVVKLEHASANITGRFWAFGVGVALFTAALHFMAHLWK